MRKPDSLFLGCVLFGIMSSQICVAQVLGSVTKKLYYANPHFSEPQFQRDLQRCAQTAGVTRWKLQPDNQNMVSRLDYRKFTDCMTATGYQLNSNGHQTDWLFFWSDTVPS